MTPTILPRELVARRLAVSVRLLQRYERHGLVRAAREGEVEGYGPAELRRLWTIVSLQRDLGVNLAGVEAILKLNAHLADVHRQVAEIARRLRAELEADLADESAE